MGEVGLAAVATTVLVVKAQVVIGRMFGRLSMFVGPKVLVIASKWFDDVTSVTKQILAIHKDWALVHRCLVLRVLRVVTVDAERQSESEVEVQSCCLRSAAILEEI